MIGIELAHDAVERNNFDQSLFATNSFDFFKNIFHNRDSILR